MKETKMENILFIQSSPRGSESYSQKVAQSIVKHLEHHFPDTKLSCAT